MAPLDAVDVSTMVSDQEVVRRVLAGDTASFELIMRRYNRRLFRIARGVLRNDADAEDVVQDSYLQAYEKLEQFSGKGPLSAWLARITVNEALSRLRHGLKVTDLLSFDDEKEGEEANFMAEPVHTLPTPEQTAARGEIRRLLESAIDLLPDHYRMVFVLCGIEEMSVAETAEILAVEPATVKTRYHRARNILRENLAQVVDDHAVEVFPFDGARCDRIVTNVLRRLEKR
ncbi:RNA polymerase sigma factor [Geomonas sp. RF6]|uniref:RNA polymerase sigma factor n=1 Tax=Geomonas sp. RF6 TaxID=2897342 RepID=UPI001E3988C8|nr:RNA polymerase sigma factor [Geomonas sp. RF6]UFS68806.1 RNA polymerase sigma factor [Geomonas sp. RF6]